MLPSTRRKILEAKVTDAIKRRYPSKHYVYAIQVTWDDGSSTVIFRRYSKFFDFQIALLETFPLEGGLKDHSSRIIPFLPGKILFRRSHVRDVALKRLKPIDEYCNTLVHLPPHISNSEHVLDFFETKSEDLNPPKEEQSKRKKKDEQDISEISGPILLEQYVAVADYDRTQPKELTVKAGQSLEVIEKHENGWWFVSDEEGERGWVPGVYLEKRDGTKENLVTKQAELGQGEKYITTAQFNGTTDEVSFGAGVLVEVLQKNLEGWWYISYQGKEGWAPASYLEKPAEAVLRQRATPGSYVATNKLQANRRSLPADSVHAVLTTSSASATTSPARAHLALTKTNSNPSSGAKAMKNSLVISKPAPNRTRPPPKRSSVKKAALPTQKPTLPPPLPPGPKLQEESVYEYVTTSPFDGNVPNGIKFQEEKKVKVLEKSPGDWWYISMEGTEGWAPASHIKKIFPHEKSARPPSRPKPPVFPEKRSTADPLVPQLHVSVNSTENKISKHERPALKPVTSRKPLVISSQGSNIANEDVSGTSKITSASSSEPKDFRAALNSAVAAKTKEQGKPRNVPTRPSKPVPAPSRPKPIKDNKKHEASNRKPHPVKPPLSSNALKKTNVTKPETSVKPTQGASSTTTESKQVDFRSVLKPTSKQSINTVKNRENKRPPTLPVKPSQPNRTVPKEFKTGPGDRPVFGSKVSSSKPATASNSLCNGKPETKAKPVRPGNKPVLRRFQADNSYQNQNGNNNNDKRKGIEKRDIVLVNRAEIPSTQPQTLPLPFNMRGLPDGQVDSSLIEESHDNDATTQQFQEKKISTLCEELTEQKVTRYVAVTDYVAENDNEMSFWRGAVATLLEKAERNWWYVNINGQSGWVPNAYFDQELTNLQTDCENNYENEKEQWTNVYENNNFPAACSDSVIPAIPTEESEAVYTEIEEPLDREGYSHENSDVYQAAAAFGATDDSMLNLSAGDRLKMLEETDTGWWYVRIISSRADNVHKEGWVPCTYLDKI